MNPFRQIAAVTVMNLSALKTRMGSSLVIVAGMAAVVAVTLSVLSLSTGLISMIQSGTLPDRIIVTSRDARGEQGSGLSRAAVQAIIDSPGIKRGPDGKPIASADALSFIPSIKKVDGLDGFVGLRGVSAAFLTLRPEIHVTEGRMFTPALHEVIVGKGVSDQFKGFELGDTLSLQDGDWTVVGRFESEGVIGSSVLTDSETMLSAFRRPGYNTVTVAIDPGQQAFDDFKAALTTNPQLTVDVDRETTFFNRQFSGFNALLSGIAYWVGAVMGLGAMFGALNTMYAAVGSRSLEIATLRAIGFGAAPVVVSVLTEALVLALAGAVAGGAVAWLAFNGKHQMMINLTFHLVITPRMFAGGILLALTVGFIGALFPAIRAARLPIAAALQAR